VGKMIGCDFCENSRIYEIDHRDKFVCIKSGRNKADSVVNPDRITPPFWCPKRKDE
jgi:hypothetical protein